MPKSWAPEVEVDGKWHRNSLRFATEQEARENARDLFARWTLTTGHRATKADEPPNYTYKNGKLEYIPPPSLDISVTGGEGEGEDTA